MAILQLSRITNRKGLQENLPQLAGAEFGWSLDERRLFIGNGKVEDGAPVVGNTEILTEFTDILALESTYIYKGAQAGYVVTTGENQTDIVRSLQAKFDERVSVKDFGAVGDGVTNDGPAINRAYYELFCREVNTEIRRTLYFPAGVYITNETILIPPHSKSFGDGITSSFIKYINPDTGNPPLDYVAVTCDSLQQTDVNLGNNGAQTPTGVEMASMSIISNEKNSVLLLNGLTKSSFEMMELTASAITADLGTDTLETASIRVEGSNSLRPDSITFNKCITGGTTYGLEIQDASKAIQFENGKLNLHFKGALLGTVPVNGGPSGVNITRTVFDQISSNGIDVGGVKLNSSAFNLFFNVGNNFGGTPTAPVINFANERNVSIGDLFQRNDTDDLIQPRIELNGTSCIAFDSSSAMLLGSYKRHTGLKTTLTGDTDPGNVFTIHPTESDLETSFKMDYTIRRGINLRTGVIIGIYNDTLGDTSYSDEYTETGSTDITLSVDVNGTNSELNYASVGVTDATFKYSIVRLD